MIELSGLNQFQIREMIPGDPVLVGYRGSIAHGMYTPGHDPNSIDDKDVMSVTIPPLSYYFGYENGGLGDRGVKEWAYMEWDSVTYEFKKFVGLLVKSNPNVLSLLWMGKQHYVHVSHEGQALIDARDLFISKQVYHAFTGYAYGQLHRMTHTDGENRYKGGYMGTKRKALVEKFGYDVKNAAHCIRLLRMGIEFLNEGVLYVDRSKLDGPQLLEIKYGHWGLQEVREEADRLFKRAEAAYDKCQFPREPDKQKVNALVMGVLSNHFGYIDRSRGEMKWNTT